jgi:hypothetical protein
LLPNHGADIGRGAHLQIMDITDVPPTLSIATESACGVSSPSSTDQSVQVNAPPPPAVAVSAPTLARGLVPPTASSALDLLAHDVASSSALHPPDGPPSSTRLDMCDASDRAACSRSPGSPPASSPGSRSPAHSSEHSPACMKIVTLTRV